MTTSIFARQALIANGWQRNVSLQINDDGRISDISLDSMANAKNSADMTVGILLPALSNVHSHSFQRAMAGLAEQRGSSKTRTQTAYDFWSWRKVMYRFLELLTPDDIETIAAQVQMEMLEAGYAASAEFHYLHHAPNGIAYDQIDELSERLFQASILSGIGYTHLPVLYMRGGLNNEPLRDGQLRFGNDLDQFQTLFEKLSERIGALPSDYVLGVAPHSLRAVSNEGIEMAAQLSSTTPVHIHIAEQINEVRDAKKALNARPVHWLLDNFEVDKHWCLIHATHMDAAEIVEVAQSHAVVGLCPITEANLGDGIFNAIDYLEQGGRYGIGSDSNIKIALSEELRMLEVSQRLRDKRRIVLSSAQTPSNGRFLYQHAALGGAQALGRDSGTIEVGAFADLVALDDEHHAICALHKDTILDTWIMACNDDIVSDVWAAGRHQVRNGVHIERSRITHKFSKTIKRLRQAL